MIYGPSTLFFILSMYKSLIMVWFNTFPPSADIQRNRLSFFRTENKLLDLEQRIQGALSFNSPDVQSCIKMLTQIAGKSSFLSPASFTSPLPSALQGYLCIIHYYMRLFQVKADLWSHCAAKIFDNFLVNLV